MLDTNTHTWKKRETRHRYVETGTVCYSRLHCIWLHVGVAEVSVNLRSAGWFTALWPRCCFVSLQDDGVRSADAGPELDVSGSWPGHRCGELLHPPQPSAGCFTPNINLCKRACNQFLSRLTVVMNCFNYTHAALEKCILAREGGKRWLYNTVYVLMFMYLHLCETCTVFVQKEEKRLSVSETRRRFYGNVNWGLSCNLLHLHPVIKTTVCISC